MNLIEQARARHAEAEMSFRRRALIARVLGRDASIEDRAVEDHHRAVVACTRELAPFTVRKAS